MDIKPVRRPMPPVQPPAQPIPRPIAPPIVEAPAPQPIEGSGLPPKKTKKSKKWFVILASILLVVALAVTGGWLWYQSQLGPVDSANTEKINVDIAAASTPTQIADLLKEKGVVKNKDVFMWYTRFEGVQNKLQAGSYRLSPSESTQKIVEHLVKGSADDTFSITFYPGATLVDKVSKPEKRIDVTSVLERAGYSSEEISTALSKTYTHPLFQDKPATADLEGYVFGETYEFTSGTKVEDILTRTFDEFYKYVVSENLVALYKQQNLNLYQGITLASIVQRESGGEDKAQIAQVFYSRLKIGMQLGSDVTYQYIADKMGVERSTTLDSPYNTRENTGLPPGPIATPGLSSLKAVASPAPGNYIYFLSGDDHVTYYATTLEGHEANIRNHCQSKCQII